MRPGLALYLLGRMVSTLGVLIESRSLATAVEWWACGEVMMRCEHGRPR